MVNFAKKLNLKKNYEIILIIVLTAAFLSLLAVPKFLGTNQTVGGQKINQEQIQLTEVSDQVKAESPQTKKDSGSQVESHQPSTTQANSVKGAATKSKVEPNSEKPKSEEPKNQVVVLEINTGTGSYSYNVSWQEDMTVYEVLAKASKKNNFSLKATWYGGIGSYYITELHGMGCCWVYKINGEGALGVSLETLDPGDVITWTHM